MLEAGPKFHRIGALGEVIHRAWQWRSAKQFLGQTGSWECWPKTNNSIRYVLLLGPKIVFDAISLNRGVCVCVCCVRSRSRSRFSRKTLFRASTLWPLNVFGQKSCFREDSANIARKETEKCSPNLFTKNPLDSHKNEIVRSWAHSDTRHIGYAQERARKLATSGNSLFCKGNSRTNRTIVSRKRITPYIDWNTTSQSFG